MSEKKYVARLSNGEAVMISEARYNQLKKYYNTHHYIPEGNGYKYSGTSHFNENSISKSNDRWYDEFRISVNKWEQDRYKLYRSKKSDYDEFVKKYLSDRKDSERSYLNSVYYYSNNIKNSKRNVKKHYKSTDNAYHTYWRSKRN